MLAHKVQETLAVIEKHMTELAPYRKPALFNEFLVKGYTAITLNSISASSFSDLLRAKLCLGTLITLYDDYADRPVQSNPQLLELLYQLSFQRTAAVRSLDPRNQRVLEFAQSLFAEMESVLNRLPHYRQFSEILNFDLAQFYTANRFSSLVMAHPYMNSQAENRLYAHHNMGMMMVAMMDLMAIDKIAISEVGSIREVFLMGQRMGRIFNVLATRNRERLDGDVSGELATFKSGQEIEMATQALRQEILALKDKIRSFDARITAFSVRAYLEGLEKVQKLHEKMEGTL